MSKAWLCIPSARPPEEAEKCLKLWRERGYNIALWFDNGSKCAAVASGDMFIVGSSEYPGYAAAVNALVSSVMQYDCKAEWFVAAGDDTEPDPNKSAEEIARECREYFGSTPRLSTVSIARPTGTEHLDRAYETFGVMQPTGDRWHEGVGGFTNAPIDRVCGSAWYGREYCRRMYQGNGPLWAGNATQPGYKHMYVDEEAQGVAIKMGVLWQRRDLTQRHNHWGRGETDKALVTNPTIPPHLEKWNTKEHWNEAKALFLGRKAAGFPGHEPL